MRGQNVTVKGVLHHFWLNLLFKKFVLMDVTVRKVQLDFMALELVSPVKGSSCHCSPDQSRSGNCPWPQRRV